MIFFQEFYKTVCCKILERKVENSSEIQVNLQVIKNSHKGTESTDLISEASSHFLCFNAKSTRLESEDGG